MLGDEGWTDRVHAYGRVYRFRGKASFGALVGQTGVAPFVRYGVTSKVGASGSPGQSHEPI